MTSIALILLHTRNVKFFPIAQGLLSGASVLRDPSATCILVNTGIKTEKLLKLSEPRKHLNYLVSQKCPTALFLQGQIFEKVGRNSDALEMYKKSVDPSNIHYDPAESINFTIGDAWRGIYRMEINNEIARAESALRKAAITYDDPLAYYHLAVGFTPKSVNEYPLYLLKAASSGNPEAADLLGTYYFKQSQGCKSLSSNESLMEATTNSENILITRGSDPVPPEMAAEKQNLAEEWFKIGAESNIESSQVHLAILSLKAGNLIQGLSWFEKVSISKKWVKTATWFRRQCESGKVDFMLLDVERLHNREDGH